MESGAAMSSELNTGEGKQMDPAMSELMRQAEAHAKKLENGSASDVVSLCPVHADVAAGQALSLRLLLVLAGKDDSKNEPVVKRSTLEWLHAFRWPATVVLVGSPSAAGIVEIILKVLQ
jgi:hypothetical protein